MAQPGPQAFIRTGTMQVLQGPGNVHGRADTGEAEAATDGECGVWRHPQGVVRARAWFTGTVRFSLEHLKGAWP